MATGPTAIDRMPIDALGSSLRGNLVRMDDPAYESVRAIWNGDVTARPVAIARCAGPADVVAVARLAAEHDLPLAVRGGGHAVAGHALCDGGLVVDLSPMNAVRVDPHRRRAWAGGGALWSDVDHETQAFGLAVTGGVVTHTGVGGLTLGGGIGHLMRKFGLSIDSLRSCDVVTATGRLVRASEDENPDLFWGLRGGGGNFGIVTNFEFELHPVGPTVYAGMVLYPMDDAPEVLRFLRDYVKDAPDEVGVLGNLRLAPALPAVPTELHGEPVVATVVCYAGDPEEGERVLAPVVNFGRPAVQAVTRKPYTAHQAMFDAALPHGREYYWKSHHLPPLTDEAIDTIVEHSERITSPYSTIPIFTLGGAASRVSADATAFGPREHLHDINIAAAWEPGDPDRERHIAWVREFYDALEDFGCGTYVNFLSDEKEKGVRAAYGDRYERLVELKDRWDPANRFRYNSNIPPSR